MFTFVFAIFFQVRQYPRMEYHLATRIRHMRSLGIPVETWMVRADARELLHELYPEKFPDSTVTSSDMFPFQASDRLLRKFFKRHGFSLRKIGTRINKKGVTGNMIEAVQQFHRKTRVLQLSERNGSVDGLTSSSNAYTHDQVPIALCSSYTKMVDSKGVDEVYDATAKGRDLKRFCSLNVYAPLKRMADGSNVPPPHIIFKASGFKTMQEWDQSEVDEYQPSELLHILFTLKPR